MVIRIQGREIEYVSPLFFSFLTETAGAISATEILKTEAGVPVIMAELDNTHLIIIR
jgi:hypothetical protein